MKKVGEVRIVGGEAAGLPAFGSQCEWTLSPAVWGEICAHRAVGPLRVDELCRSWEKLPSTDAAPFMPTRVPSSVRLQHAQEQRLDATLVLRHLAVAV
ncbi:hypothetical protein PAPYR_7991 [Paratrimastix pyriformis]|uniref:Uncharacterized protein n=1 Tax=Paratrimastix pyriformis TaxID=342808 RepID=A0ABQ8UBM6_9EUKA|nr:hypothetical protein PAPYR_7991 [Paratrimastix pyriformis]